MKKLIIIALLFVPMSAFAASNTAQDAYNWIQQAIPEMAQTKTEASNAILDEQVLQTNVNTDFTNAKDYTNQAVNGILGEANSNADVSIKAADSEQDAEMAKQTQSTLAQAQTDANGALSSALSSSAKGDAATLASANSYTNTAQSNSEGFATAGDKTTLALANQTSANGDKATLAQANQFSIAGDKTTLVSANADAQVMANVAQSNSESYASTTAQTDANAAQSNSEAYTNQSYQQANANAQGYAQQAQSNAENFAQGAANQAQINSEQYAASGIAAALAMPPAPFLPVGHAYIGVQEGTYDGQFATGIRGTYQITSSLDANVGVSGGSGLYGHVAVTAGMGYEFGG